MVTYKVLRILFSYARGWVTNYFIAICLTKSSPRIHESLHCHHTRDDYTPPLSVLFWVSHLHKRSLASITQHRYVHSWLPTCVNAYMHPTHSQKLLTMHEYAPHFMKYAHCVRCARGLRGVGIYIYTLSVTHLVSIVFWLNIWYHPILTTMLLK